MGRAAWHKLTQLAKVVHITLAVRLIRYSTVRHRQCLKVDKAAIDQDAQMFHHLYAQFLKRRVILDGSRS
jgi:hypothetical protein